MALIPPHRRSPPAWMWAIATIVVALLPLTPGLSGSRMFYIRDLSLFFWGRYVWLRRAWLSGEFPLWDPYVGGGQATFVDAMHQMYLAPAIVLRLIGNEVLGFNLWVAAPIPLAALGAWLFLRRRFSIQAATLGAMGFALCGPVYSTANFPNMSWTVAAMPWVLFAVDRLAAAPSPRGLVGLASVVALQSFAGEPVSQLSTLLLAATYALLLCGPPTPEAASARLGRHLWVAGGLSLGLLLAVVQLLPMGLAATMSDRAHALNNPHFWSLHPLALVEAVAPRLLGDYYTSQSLASIPWAPLVNSGREPFFFSIYFGVPMLALVVVGLAGPSHRRWALFWTAAALISLAGAFGNNTPVYPFLRSHLPLLASFRYPAKYFVVAAMAASALVAAGWETLVPGHSRSAATPGVASGPTRAALGTTALAALVALLTLIAWSYWTTPLAFRLFAVAKGLGAPNPVGAAEFMLKALPPQAVTLLLLSAATGVLLAVSQAHARPAASAARALLFALIVTDLLVRAWPINPVLESTYLAEPEWIARTRIDPHARFYIGGKRDGTLFADDPDSARGFLNPPALRGSASRAAVNTQTAYSPSAWGAREMLSLDLAALWPKTYDIAAARFYESDAEARSRFLERTGTRFRIVRTTAAGNRQPLMPVPYYFDANLYDWGPDVAPRASVVAEAEVASVDRQLDALFGADWAKDRALVERLPDAAGIVGPPEPQSARIVAERSNALRIDASAGASGGYLVLLDHYDPGWRASVDGQPTAVVRANGLFRAVRLPPGRHAVTFQFVPTSLYWGATVSGVSALVALVLFVWPTGRPSRRGHHRDGASDAPGSREGLARQTPAA